MRFVYSPTRTRVFNRKYTLMYHSFRGSELCDEFTFTTIFSVWSLLNIAHSLLPPSYLLLLPVSYSLVITASPYPPLTTHYSLLLTPRSSLHLPHRRRQSMRLLLIEGVFSETGMTIHRSYTWLPVYIIEPQTSASIDKELNCSNE